jgi:hypothetical protein
MLGSVLAKDESPLFAHVPQCSRTVAESPECKGLNVASELTKTRSATTSETVLATA